MSSAPQAAHPAFEWVRTVPVASLKMDVSEYRHRRTGATHYHLATDNPENVFLVALRTMPMDSTGVAHILEHTALCGSRNFPVRDPFFLMIRRSLNTFMNAFTSSDWTAYPFASQNRKDFDNLLSVYLDAVFFARLDPRDFAQEGIRVEFTETENPESPLVYKGVVFNEMKGAMSSATSTLFETLNKYLFPTTTYHFNSGGDPEAIPDLAYEGPLAFYKTHYHPSNAVFMTFGDLPAAELQEKFEQRALKEFTALPEKIRGHDEKRYLAPLHVEEAYALDEESSAEKTHLVLGWLLGKTADLTARFEANLLNGVLLENSASPLRLMLETSDLGTAPSPLCGVDDSGREMSFMCGLEGSAPERAAELENSVLDVLEKVALDGVPYEDVEAVLHQLELSQREIGGDHYPYGLQLILNGLGAILHDGDPLALWDMDAVLTGLREKIRDPDYIKQLTRKYLLDNQHRVRLTLRPDTTLSQRRVAAEAARLAEIQKNLSAADKQRIITDAKALAERQEQKDDVSVLPKVDLSDIPADIFIAEGERTSLQCGDETVPLAVYAQGTNGLFYQQIIIDLPALSARQQQLLPLYTTLVTELGAGERDYLGIQQWQSQVSGGLRMGLSMRTSLDNAQQAVAHLVFSGKALASKHVEFQYLMLTMLESVHFTEADRARELLSQLRARWESSVTGQGHALAMQAAASGMSAVAAFQYRLNGLPGIRFIKELDTNSITASMDSLLLELADLHVAVLQAPRQFLLIGEAERLAELQTGLQGTWSASRYKPKAAAFRFVPSSVTVRQAWLTNTQVQFCSRAYPAVPVEHADAPALMVLGGFLRNGFLHRAIREQGGAYGGGAGYDGNACAFRFYSYRDPRLSATLQDFDASIAWLLNTEHEPRQLEEALLGIIADMDKPLSPAGEARQSFHNTLYGRTPEQRKRSRERLLAVTLKDLKRVGKKYLLIEKASTAVVAPLSKAAEVEALGLAINKL